MNLPVEPDARPAPPDFMSVRQVAEYLQLNEKKIYSLLKTGDLPGTKITGKWLFPRELVDRWVVDSAHGGLLNDRLLIGGGDDPLLERLVLEFSHHLGARALTGHHPSGTREGLELLQAGRIDASLLHWGPEHEAHTRHPALLRQYPKHPQWLLLRLFRRHSGIMYDPRREGAAESLRELLSGSGPGRARWSLCREGSGNYRFFEEACGREGHRPPEARIALSARDAAAQIRMDLADCAPGPYSVAREFGLGFLPLGWEAVDLVVPRHVYFRHLLQQLIDRFTSQHGQETAQQLQGYDLSDCGRIVWGHD